MMGIMGTMYSILVFHVQINTSLAATSVGDNIILTVSINGELDIFTELGEGVLDGGGCIGGLLGSRLDLTVVKPSSDVASSSITWG
jgi:hypothetical protein